jgi:tetratricopeptide (TPR) repeat protein
MADYHASFFRGFLKRLWKPQSARRQADAQSEGKDMASATVLASEVSDVVVTFKRALQLHQQGALERAQSLYQEILVREPHHFDALFLSGVIAMHAQNYSKALEYLGVARETNPDSPDVCAAMGDAHAALHCYDDAIASYESALALAPGNMEVLVNSALPLHKLGRNAAALVNLDLALCIQPDNVAALVRRGNVLDSLERMQDALSSYEQALQLDGQNAEALNNRGQLLVKLGRTQDAVASFDLALQFNPRYPDALSNRGLALCDLHQYEGAAKCYDLALAIAPEYANAHYNRSLCSLLSGDLDSGWSQYEWRWQIEQFQPFARNFSCPLWLGAGPLSGKSILLHAEQGLGDTIQFCRYAPLMAQRGARVYLESPEQLKHLLSSLEGVEQIFTRGELPAQFDFHCPLLSLPLAFQTRIDTIPNSTPYLSADSARVDHWQQTLEQGNKFRVGLVWSGNPGHRNDNNRSIPLSLFARVLVVDADFVSLQREIRDTDKAALEQFAGIFRCGDALNDFSDTAALAECMDLIITVDTAVAHLAGALAKNVWILLPYNPDWRWLLERTDSPWYPTARLFRQRNMGGWREVIEEVTTALREMVRRKSFLGRY